MQTADIRAAVQTAIETDETLRGLFEQAEFWKALAGTPGIPADLAAEAQANARDAYDRAEAHFFRGR